MVQLDMHRRVHPAPPVAEFHHEVARVVELAISEPDGEARLNWFLIDAMEQNEASQGGAAGRG